MGICFSRGDVTKETSQSRDPHSSNKGHKELIKNNGSFTNVEALPITDGRPIVIAIGNYTASLEGDLTFSKGDRLRLLRDSDQDWPYAENVKTGEKGHIPINYVAKEESLECFEWFKRCTKADAGRWLKNPNLSNGVFLVRDSETNQGTYVLSVKYLDAIKGTETKHYRIKQMNPGGFCIAKRVVLPTILELVNYYKVNTGLCCNLTDPCPTRLPETDDRRWEIPRSSITFCKKLGEGFYGEVWQGKLNGVKDIAIKKLKEGKMKPEEFIAEAEIMKKYSHNKLVKLLGVCTLEEPIYILTEFMCNGSLLNYLKEHAAELTDTKLIDYATQVSEGMAYMEQNQYIHRDLAARNVLVGENNFVKIGDFGMARLIEDDEYDSKGGNFPVKWTAPEALSRRAFSIKSDVWSFGILLVEIMTRGMAPYPGIENRQILQKLERGYRHPRPQDCNQKLYQLMLQCWNIEPQKRPTFKNLYECLNAFNGTVEYDDNNQKVKA